MHYFGIYLKQFLHKSKNKKSYLVGDLNLILLDHSTNTKVKNYINPNIQNFLIHIINKSTRLTKMNTALTDPIEFSL